MNIFDAITGFFTANLNDIVIIAIVYIVGQLMLAVLDRKIKRHTAARGAGRSSRSHTIAQLVHNVGHTVLLLIIIFWLLRMIGIDPTPIIASAGVVGLAIGFGAQTLVKDFISGLFIIAESQYVVGDLVKISGFEGTVECLSVRSTVLRDADGHKIFIPNGSVTSVVNLSDKARVC